MDLEKELAEVRSKSKKVTNLIGEMGKERLILLETLNRIHQLGNDRQKLLGDMLRMNNRIAEIETKLQEREGQP